MTYVWKGRQYVVIAAGGHAKSGTKRGDQLDGVRAAEFLGFWLELYYVFEFLCFLNQIAAMWGGPDPKTGRVSPLRTLIDMDGADHRAYRGLTQAWFMPANLKKLEPRMPELAKRYVDKMMAMGPECDFTKDIAVYYPLHVIMSIMGVPESDEPHMLKLTQELFGGGDPDMQREERDPNTNVIADFFMYFNKMTEERRAHPGEDLATVIANGKVNGCPLGPVETASYYIIVATAGHDTTSSSIAGGLRALIENPEQLKKLKDNPELLNTAVDEIIRWVTPVQHFMRTATEDYTLRGKTIKKGEAVQLLYLSGNRDEEIWPDSFKFDISARTTVTSPSAMAPMSASASIWPKWKSAPSSRNCSAASIPSR